MPSTKREQNKFYITQKRIKEFDKNLTNKKSNLMTWNAEHIL